MVDIRKFYQNESDYLKAADLKPGEQYPLTVAGVEAVEFDKDGGGKEHKLALSFRGTNKKLVLNRTNAMTIETLYGPETEHWIGERILVFVGTSNFQGRDVAALKVGLPMREASLPVAEPVPRREYQPPEPAPRREYQPPAPPVDDFDQDIPF